MNVPKSSKNKSNFGSLIKTHRKLLGLTQEELADQIGVKFQQIQKYEYNTNLPSIENAIKICKILKIPTDKIFGENHKDDLIKEVKKEVKDNYQLIKLLNRNKELLPFIKSYDNSRKELQNTNFGAILKNYINLSPKSRQIFKAIIRKLPKRNTSH